MSDLSTSRRKKQWGCAIVAGALAVVMVILLVVLELIFPADKMRAKAEEERAAAILSAPTPEGAHPAIRNLWDQGNPEKKLVADPNNGVRQVVVGISCPTDQIVPCGAEATRAAALWLAKRGAEWGDYKGEPVTRLLINVDPDGKSGGYQLFGAMPAPSTLVGGGAAEILTAFHWNGAGENGEISVAGWCGKSGQRRQTPAFCQAFFEDECHWMKTAPVVKACPSELLRRDEKEN